MTIVVTGGGMRASFRRALSEIWRIVSDVGAIALVTVAVALLLLGAARLAWLWLTS